MSVWVMEVGYDYEGDDVHSVYATAQAAIAGAQAYVDQDEREQERSWSFDAGALRWESGSKHVHVTEFDVLPGDPAPTEAPNRTEGPDVARALELVEEAFCVYYDAACSEDYGRTSRLLDEAAVAAAAARAALLALQAPACAPGPSGEAPSAWGVIITEYPDEGCMGPYATREEAEEAARTNLSDDETEIVPLNEEHVEALTKAHWEPPVAQAAPEVCTCGWANDTRIHNHACIAHRVEAAPRAATYAECVDAAAKARAEIDEWPEWKRNLSRQAAPTYEQAYDAAMDEMVPPREPPSEAETLARCYQDAPSLDRMRALADRWELESSDAPLTDYVTGSHDARRELARQLREALASIDAALAGFGEEPK